tara:strand:- start:6375 stop:6671 length:297 start_codon:yes stop_codon:yes gene_type:complete
MPLAWFSLRFFFVFATVEQLRPFGYNHPQDYPILPASYLLILQKECPFSRPGKERAGTKGQGPFENQRPRLSFSTNKGFDSLLYIPADCWQATELITE